MRKRKSKSEKAFTLVEILVVVLLVALFTVASGGYFVKTYKNVQFKNTVKDIVTTLSYARLWSIENQKNCSFNYDVANQKMMISTESIDEDLQIIKNQYVKEIILTEDSQVAKFEIEAVQQDTSQQTNGLIFYPDGTCDNAIIEMANEHQVFTLVLNAATGSIEVYQAPFEQLDIKTKTVDLDLQTEGLDLSRD